ncbi:general substrate transporter [Xylariaceae sp. FL0662B]|nr:general substrate transporter [Xylariaceae sp. FL0662B]
MNIPQRHLTIQHTYRIKMRTIGNIYFITAIAVIGGALFGFDITAMSAIISTQPYLCQFNELGHNPNGECRGPTSAVQGGITASMPAGSWLGALCSGFLSDRLGRRRAIQIGAVIWVVGSVITCAAVDIPMLCVGRIINGFSIGICSAQVPVYVSELAPPSIRGRLISIQQWAITWGIMIMFFMCYGTSFIKGNASFRLPWGLQMIPAFPLFFGLMILPESPRWLAKRDLWDEARDVLVLVHAKGDMNSPFVAKELAEIRATIELERENASATYLELFQPRNLNRTIVGMFSQIWCQMSGMNVMMYYITYVFTMAGLGDDVLMPSSIQFVINVVMTIPAMLWLDRWGRRPTLLVGAFLMTLWLCVNAGLFAVYSVEPYPGQYPSESESMSISGAPAKAIIASTYLFVASYAPTWGPVSWTYAPELFSLRHRGKAVALSTSACWAFNFALAYFVPPAFANITWKTYVLFAVFCATMFFHVLFFFPETANKPLEEIDEIFDDTKPGAIPYIGTPAWKTHNDRSIIRHERGEIRMEEKLVEVKQDKLDKAGV